MSDDVRRRIFQMSYQESSHAQDNKRFINEVVPGKLAAAHERFKVAMQEQLGRLQVGVQQAFVHAPGYEVLYQDPKSIVSIINGYVGRTLFSSIEDPLIAETVEFMEQNQAAKAATVVAAPKQ